MYMKVLAKLIQSFIMLGCFFNITHIRFLFLCYLLIYDIAQFLAAVNCSIS
jgi:hypothetical protein